jgi:2-keto-4-pentenoate hydratase
MRRGSSRKRLTRPEKAARRLLEAHEKRERFAPLVADFAPRTLTEACAIQDAFVALRAQKLGARVGYKVALTSEAMRRFVGVDTPQAGVMLDSTILRTPARVRAADYVRLVVEFEIAVQLADDLPSADKPFFRDRVAKSVGSVMAALELADDRNADYTQLARYPLDLIADNCWNEGAVLGRPVQEWRHIDLAEVRGVAAINGKTVGEGRGRDAMGHPFDAVAWLADHLASIGRGMVRGDVVITGSIVASKYPNPGDLVQFDLGPLGGVELRVD